MPCPDDLRAALGPWATLRDDLDWRECPDDVWQQLLVQAPKLAAISRYWFEKGLHRAIDEMERKIDGKPMWVTRDELIKHLRTIHAPK